MQRPAGIGAFQFVILASLRAAQLMRGCVPRVDGMHKTIVIAQLEVSQGLVIGGSALDAIGGAPADLVTTAAVPAVVAEVV